MKATQEINKLNFKDINWGPDEAKGDSNLNTYFIKIPEYEGIKLGNYRYIIGRKGTGKTAIIEQLKNEAEAQYDSFYKYMSLKNFPIQSIRAMKDRSQGDKSQFVPIWTFLIITELCKLICEDESAKPTDAILDLKEFIRVNFPSDLGFQETLKLLESTQNKVSISASWLGSEDTSSASREMFVNVHYQKAIEILFQLIKGVRTKSKYFLFFDELDEGYSANDKGLNLLILSLLRAVENLHIELQDYLQLRPVLALRSDIFENLEDNDLNKLDDYIVNLRWTMESKSRYSLYDLVNARINAKVNLDNPNQAWKAVAKDNDPELPRAFTSLWDFIYNRTFERPRDIVKFMKICSRFDFEGKLDFKTAKSAEIQYSDWFYKEFRDEVQSHLGIWQEVTQAIIKLGKAKFKLEEITQLMLRNSTISNYLTNHKQTTEDILQTLFDFGLIGNYGGSKKQWFFRYKDHNLPFNSEMVMIVHFGFTRKFRMKVY